MTNAVKKVIPLSIIYTIFAVLFTNYILLDKLKFTNALPDFILYIIYAVILYFTCMVLVFHYIHLIDNVEKQKKLLLLYKV